jgi:hypothetical protein
VTALKIFPTGILISEFGHNPQSSCALSNLVNCERRLARVESLCLVSGSNPVVPYVGVTFLVVKVVSRAVIKSSD